MPVSRMRQIIARLLDVLSPRHCAPRDAQVLLQERLLVCLLLGAVLVNLLLAVVLRGLAVSPLEWIFAAAALLNGLLLRHFRARGQLTGVTLMAITVFLLTCSAFMALAGGLQASPALVWLVSGPWMAAMILPRRGQLAMTGVSLLILLSLGLAGRSALLPASAVSADTMNLLLLICTTGVLALGAALAFVQARLGAEVRGEGRLDHRRDGLSGLLTLDAFEDAVRDLQDHQACNTAALLVCDLDQLQALNRQYGRSFGNQLLRATSGCLQQQLRDKDLCARVGGDRFAVWLHDTPVPAAQRIAERVREQLARLQVANPAQSLTTLTISGALLLLRPSDGVHFDALLETAQRGLDEAKQGGRNQITELDLRPKPSRQKAA